MNNGKTTLRLALSMTICLLSMAGLDAQNGFNMPLSQFGVGNGELPYSFGIAQRMGGAIYTRSGNNYINPFNPASYAGIERESFVFDMGVNIQVSRTSNATQSLGDADGDIAYLAVGMPVTGWWKLAAGLMPFSTVDYSSTSTQTDNEFGSMKTVYDGTGGVNELFVGSAFNIPAGKGRTLQAGFNVGYLTGSVNRAISYSFQGNDSTYYVDSRRYRKTRFGNVIIDLGVQLRQSLGERYTMALGMVYKPYMDMNVTDLALIYTYDPSDESLVDTIFPTRGGDAEFDSRLEQAQTFGLGLSLERNNAWMVEVDATFGQWNGLKYTEDATHSVFGADAMDYRPFSRLAAGFEKMVDMDAQTYLGRIGWSIGAHKENGTMRLMLNGKEHRLDSWGVGAGACLPMRKGRSLLTLSVSYLSLGNTDLLRRDCVTFGISVSSCERWFMKRKYN